MKRSPVLVKLIAGFLVCAGAFTLIAAGGQDKGGAAAGAGAENVTPPGTFPIVKTPVTMNMAIRQNTFVENYETNLYTKMLEEKTGIKFNIEVFPVGAPGLEKLLIVIAGGGTLPEIALDFSFNDEQMYNLGQEGVALSLNDYYEKWSYYIPQQLAKLEDKNMLRWLHSADGNIYYIPQVMEQWGEIYSLRGWMNQAWLDKLGLKTPTTTAEFKTVLQAFANRDPNGNGRRDEIGAGGNTDQRGKLHDFLINAFIYNDTRDRLIVDAAGKVDVIYNKPEYRDALRYLRELMAEGLILDQLFTISAGNLRGIIESQDVATVGFFTAGFAGAVSPNNKLRLEYVPIAPLKGPKGVQWTPYMPQSPSKRMVITKDAKNPIAAFRLGDFMCSEEASIFNRFGQPEKDWRLPRPGEKSMYDVIGMKPRLAQILPWGATQNSHWAQGAPAFYPMGLMDGQVAPDNPLDNERWISMAVPLHMNLEPPFENRVDYTMPTFDEMEQLRDLKTTINSYVNESLALFVMGQRDIERDWDAYVRELERMGLQRYIQITQSSYERAIGKKK